MRVSFPVQLSRDIVSMFRALIDTLILEGVSPLTCVIGPDQTPVMVGPLGVGAALGAAGGGASARVVGGRGRPRRKLAGRSGKLRRRA